MAAANTRPQRYREPFHWRLHRLLVTPTAWLLLNLQFSANAVTVLGGAAGIAALVCAIALPAPMGLVVGAVLLQVWTLSDLVDGVVARARVAAGRARAGRAGTFVDEAVHHFLVGGLVLPALAVLAWSRGEGTVYLALAGAYLLRKAAAQFLFVRSLMRGRGAGGRSQGLAFGSYMVKPAVGHLRLSFLEQVHRHLDFVMLGWAASAALLLDAFVAFPAGVPLVSSFSGLASWSIAVLVVETAARFVPAYRAEAAA